MKKGTAGGVVLEAERIPLFKFQEAVTDPAEGTDAYQMILPKGEIFTRGYGKLTIDETFVDALVTNWKNKVLGERVPYIDEEHRGGPAYGWILDLANRPDGLYVKIGWTDLGREAVTKGFYRYFSASLGSAVDPDTGDEIFPS